MPTEDKLTFIEDRVILIISTLGLLLVTAAVFWVVRQSPDWGAINRVEGEEEGAEGLLQGRTRVVAGGREALKAARKQAKKRAKAEFRESSVGQKRRNRVQQHEKKRQTTLEGSLVGQERAHEAAQQALLRLKSYILNHKVSSLETLEIELSMSSPEIAAKIEELESRGVFTGIMIDDARGPDGDGGNKGPSFVRISDDEMRTIATFINERGRLTVAEVAIEANRVLHLLDGSEEIHEMTSRQTTEGPEEDTPTCEETLRTEAPSDGLQNGIAERT